ncbi:MAG: hypothetical protein HOE76_03805 [Euryarchaeota archaeon]|jgi:hypothetical protein|nr:hypothetical protein [Euryarchaeota archaeon]MBT4982240.1 hypothetical protein [Euryarchaeota archaeon]MBT5183867.1 hypothetical protein [Euryarchaeota archaeon]
MRQYFLVFLLITSTLSGCFGSDEWLDEEHGIPGGLALACLQDTGFEKMEIHFLYEEDYDPIAMDLVKSRLQEVCDKPGGITIKAEETNFAIDTAWTSDDVRDARWKHGGDAMGSNTLHWYFLFPAGTHSDESVLGVAVDASTVAIFKDSVDEAEGLFGRPSNEEVERAVTIHETGHLLGLVNLVYNSPIDHEDSSHKGHSNNDNSVMYWAIESSDVGNFITGNLPDEFDDDDKADLEGMASGDLECNKQLWS